jgi:hypothetical protein
MRGSILATLIVLLVGGALACGGARAATRHRSDMSPATAARASAAAPLDARSLVTQPREAGGVRSVTGAWTYLGDDGVYPLADAIGPNVRVPDNIAYQVTYAGLVGADLKTRISSIAVVLPSVRAARRLLARTDALEGFLPENSSPTSPTRALNGTDAMRSGQSGGSATIAWTKGRLYGLVNASGPAAGRAAQLAASGARRFTRALAGDHLQTDSQLTATPSYASPLLPAPTPVSPAPKAHVISRAGRYTLADLGVTQAQAFDPVAGEHGISLPVTFDLPETPSGRWLWRATVHVLVTLAPTASPGIAGVDPLIANVSGPGADFEIARNLTTGRPVMVEMTRHVATSQTFEVTSSAMLGGNPSPRQDTTIGFIVRSFTSQPAFTRVTVLPDSAIEVFDDPAQIGRFAVLPARVVKRP